MDCEHFYGKVSEVHLQSWHRDHFGLKCKGAPAYAVIRMKRTRTAFLLAMRVKKGGTAIPKPRPFIGMKVFYFGKKQLHRDK